MKISVDETTSGKITDISLHIDITELSIIHILLIHYRKHVVKDYHLFKIVDSMIIVVKKVLDYYDEK